MMEDVAVDPEITHLGSWHSYPHIFNLGHKAITELLLDPVLVEEKVDGSQFSFGRFDGFLKCRSKGAQLNTELPEKMFAPAVEVVKNLPLREGWTYRGEYLGKPKHNTLAYDRIPNNHIILFDVNHGEEAYVPRHAKELEAERLGLEIVPVIYEGVITDTQEILKWLDRESVLGGQKIEGVVIKNYSRFGIDKKVLMGKYVSEAFKEVHGGDWRERHPKSGDIIQTLIDKYRTPARWAKALQHMKELGKITDSPQDIGPLMKESKDDIERECADEIKKALFEYAIEKILRATTHGLPEWYKQELLKNQIVGGEPSEPNV